MERICIEVGCRYGSVPGTSRCPEHTGSWGKYAVEHPELVALYRGGRWAAARRRHLAANPSCVVCGAKATHVDHILNRARGGAGLDPTNLQSLCARHHLAKTNAESRIGNKRRAARREK